MRGRRPVNKFLKYINRTITNTQAGTTLYTATQAGTLTGLRWSIDIENATATNTGGIWVIILIPHGTAAGTLTIGDGADMYIPEQMVLAFGCYQIKGNTLAAANTGGDYIKRFDGQSKAMRKLRAGDVISYLTLGSGVNEATAAGGVQFFLKE